LRADGCAFFTALLDANLRHAGALRLDHAFGLRRLFWIPEGASPAQGAYVRYPEAPMLAELARASRRHGALVIAEDLGTAPEGFSEEIRRWGLLSSRVMLFERDARGFRPAGSYPRQCLATANTHDLPPLAALDGDADLVLRRRVGQILDDDALEAARAERRVEQQALRARLREDGLSGDAAPSESDQVAAGVTSFLCATPCRLVGLSLDDLAGEVEPLNLPGVASDRYPSWIRRMRTPVERLFDDSRARRMLAAVPDERRLVGRRPW
jgi:4-alpha-glucanotransferase